MNQKQFSEHDKLHAIREQSQAISDFLEWAAREKGWHLGWQHQHTHVSAQYDLTNPLAEFFEIDLSKLEDEKRAMLEITRLIRADGRSGRAYKSVPDKGK